MLYTSIRDMNKKLKIGIIVGSFVALLLWGVVLIFGGIRGHQINFLWAGGLALLTILYGIFGLFTAKHWSWLKSKVGQAVFFISAGVIMWGIGQAGWTYYLFKFPNQEYQPARILDILFFSSIPLWFYGMIKLTRATGAKYGLKKIAGKLLALGLTIIMFAVSYYFLVNVARGGSDYFEQPVWDQFFNLGYSFGDAIILTFAIAIFALSWRYLGGIFKKPIIAILLSFAVLFFADILFNFRSLKNVYYNGDISDILFLVAFALLTVALCMLDPSSSKNPVVAETTVPSPVDPFAPNSVIRPQNPAINMPAQPQVAESYNDLGQGGVTNAS
jgi:hypothetical protein